MPTSESVNVLQEIVRFAEGETLSIPVPVVNIGEGLLVPNHVTMKHILVATRPQRESIQAELRAFLRGVSQGHATMIAPMQITMDVVTRAPDPPVSKRRHRRGAHASLLIEGSPRDWVFYLVNWVLPRTSLEVLQACPGCGRAFVRVTKKRFHSAQCQRRTYMRERRAAERAVKEQHRS